VLGTDADSRMKAVSTYRSRALQTMPLKTGADLTHYAIKNALLD
jgi:hypothetical protein